MLDDEVVLMCVMAVAAIALLVILLLFEDAANLTMDYRGVNRSSNALDCTLLSI